MNRSTRISAPSLQRTSTASGSTASTVPIWPFTNNGSLRPGSFLFTVNITSAPGFKCSVAGVSRFRVRNSRCRSGPDCSACKTVSSPGSSESWNEFHLSTCTLCVNRRVIVAGGLLRTRDCRIRAVSPHTRPMRKSASARTKTGSSCRRTLSRTNVRKLRRRPCRRLKRPIVTLRLAFPHRRQLQEIAGGDDLTAAERLIAPAQPPEQKFDKLELPPRQHGDFVNDEHFAPLHAVEPGEDGPARIALQLREVIFVRLSRRRSNQHPAEPVNRHAADVQRRHAGRRGDADAALVADRKVRNESPQLRAFARAARAGEENIPPGFCRRME